MTEQLTAVRGAVCGVPVPAVASPDSLDELAAVLGATAEDGRAVVVAGSGSKLEIGGPPTRLDLLVRTTALTELIEYNPHDLVIRAQAGMPLALLQQIAAENRQWLALDPPEATATLGGVVAANASGPRRHRYGTVRDLLVGATFVLADGTVSHTGGKVVKNVAGYDLDKLLTGSYGTLAALAELTFRLHPRPPATVVVRTPLAGATASVPLIAAYRTSTLEPTALELRLELPGGRVELIALFEGHLATARAQAEAGAALAAAAGLPAAITDGGLDPDFAAHPWRDGAPGLRIAYPPAGLPGVLAALSAALAGPGLVHARAGIGVLELAPEAAFDAAGFGELVDRLRSSTAHLGANVVVVSAPPDLKAGLDVWGPTPGLGLMRATKHQFDPDHRLAPGRFVGGI